MSSSQRRGRAYGRCVALRSGIPVWVSGGIVAMQKPKGRPGCRTGLEQVREPSCSW